ncbi:MAG: hypothetical protein PHI06_10300 [Desulfobulbaceae bacterium]|nr:hypothetical protein [Desulfobulbaceae bacterium]
MLRSLLHKINPFSKGPHLAVVFVEYKRKQEPTADQIFAIAQQYLAHLKGWEITYLRVDNRNEQMPLTKSASNIFVVGGDNSSHEFSGWQRGINILNLLNCQYDLALIINDAFLKPGPSFLQDYATPELLQKSLSEKKIIGRIDSAFQGYTLFGYDVSRWICTNCFFVPKTALDALGNMVLIEDNIGEIFPSSYNPHHLIKDEPLALDAGTGDFQIECSIPPGHHNEIRIKLRPSQSEQESNKAHDNLGPIAIIKEISLNNQPLEGKHLIRGFTRDRETLRAEQSFLLELPKDEILPSHLHIKGCLLPETHKKLLLKEISVRIYNDALLYQDKAPLNRVYQRWIIEWLTEKWHSRFEISQDTWQLFTTKAAAIFNEALLTAKFKELGYPPESYGSKGYY